MRLTARQAYILRNLARATNHGARAVYEIRQLFGWMGAKGFDVLALLESKGLIVRVKHGRNNSDLNVTDAGRNWLKENEDRGYGLTEPRRRREVPSAETKNLIAERNEKRVYAASYCSPEQIITDDDRRALYRGMRYSSGGFSEIVDLAIPARRALEGYSGRNE